MSNNASELNKRIGRKIKKLRQALGIKQEYLAEKLGLQNHQTVSEIEAGRRALKAFELPIICKELGVDLSEVLREARPRLEPVVLWREAPDSSEEKKFETLFIKKARDFSIVENILGVKPLTRLPSLPENLIDESLSEASGEGEKIADYLDLGPFPGTTLAKILEENHDIKIFFDNLCQGWDWPSAATTYDDDFGFAVLMNSSNSPWRRNFDLAHELFHILTWNTIPPTRIKADPELSKRIEKCANAFASGLLLPKKLLVKVLKQCSEHGKLGVGDMISVARQFDVSIDALLWRLLNLGYMTREKVDELLKSDNFRSEDKDARKASWEQAPKHNRRFLRLLCQANKEGKISRARVAELLGVSLIDLESEFQSEGFELVDPAEDDSENEVTFA